MFRIESNVPVVAYQHSPFENNRGNDSSLLLPETVLGQDYVVVSYNPSPVAPLAEEGLPSYFEVIALSDNTDVEWTPPVATHGNGLPIRPVAAGQTGSVKMNRYDTMRITASDNNPEFLPIRRDISGTVIHASRPVWVVGATRCGVAPAPENYVGSTCDPMQELVLPLMHWGRRYVAIAPPARNDEWSHWRVYSGRDSVTVTSDPPLPQFPHTFERRGDFIDVAVESETPFVLASDGGPFLPVLHLQSRDIRVWNDDDPPTASLYMGSRANYGDPAMVQMVPTAQFLARYVFMTGIGFGENWAVLIREQGNGSVFVDDDEVTQWEPVGAFEIARVSVVNVPDDGSQSHVAIGDDPFGLIQIGYSSNVAGEDGCVNPGEDGVCNSSYAYPGGMKSEIITVP